MRFWRDFRVTLGADQTDADHLRSVAMFWSKCPLVPFSIDWDHPEDWPGPWEILAEDDLCPTGLAILMAQTLLLSPSGRWTADRLRIQILRDGELGYCTVVVIDGREVLGYEAGVVTQLTDLDDHAVVVGAYRISGDHYISEF